MGVPVSQQKAYSNNSLSFFFFLVAVQSSLSSIRSSSFSFVTVSGWWAA